MERQYGLTVNSEPITCTALNTTVNVFSRNHLLDHLVVSELTITEDGMAIAGGKRLFRELFESNAIDFDEVITELVSLQFPFVHHPEDIPEQILEAYSGAAARNLDGEWVYYAGEA